LGWVSYLISTVISHITMLAIVLLIGLRMIDTNGALVICPTGPPVLTMRVA